MTDKTDQTPEKDEEQIDKLFALLNENVRLERELRAAKNLLGEAAHAIPECSGPVHERIFLLRTHYSDLLRAAESRLRELDPEPVIRGWVDHFRSRLAGERERVIEECVDKLQSEAHQLWPSGKDKRPHYEEDVAAFYRWRYMPHLIGLLRALATQRKL